MVDPSPIIPVLERLQQEDYEDVETSLGSVSSGPVEVWSELQAHLDYKERPCFSNTK